MLRDAINKQIFLESTILKAMRNAHAVQVEDIIVRINQIRKGGGLEVFDNMVMPETAPKQALPSSIPPPVQLSALLPVVAPLSAPEQVPAKLETTPEPVVVISEEKAVPPVPVAPVEAEKPSSPVVVPVEPIAASSPVQEPVQETKADLKPEPPKEDSVQAVLDSAKVELPPPTSSVPAPVADLAETVEPEADDDDEAAEDDLVEVDQANEEDAPPAHTEEPELEEEMPMSLPPVQEAPRKNIVPLSSKYDCVEIWHLLTDDIEKNMKKPILKSFMLEGAPESVTDTMLTVCYDEEFERDNALAVRKELALINKRLQEISGVHGATVNIVLRQGIASPTRRETPEKMKELRNTAENNQYVQSVLNLFDGKIVDVHG